jgi:RNA polymerase sigma-70 factor (ECF subfamily)
MMNFELTGDSSPWKTKLTVIGKELDDTLARARRLDSNALAQIHDHYYSEVYRYVRYRLDDQQACEDITSEVFLRFLDALHRQLGPTTSLRGWLMGTASNLVNDYLRHHYARPVENLEDNGEAENLEDGLSPESSLDDALQKRKVRQAIRQLTMEQQHVLALRFSEERSLDETARIIGKSVTAVKALQFRALASLRRLLREDKE